MAEIGQRSLESWKSVQLVPSSWVLFVGPLRGSSSRVVFEGRLRGSSLWIVWIIISRSPCFATQISYFQDSMIYWYLRRGKPHESTIFDFVLKVFKSYPIFSTKFLNPKTYYFLQDSSNSNAIRNSNQTNLLQCNFVSEKVSNSIIFSFKILSDHLMLKIVWIFAPKTTFLQDL